MCLHHNWFIEKLTRASEAQMARHSKDSAMLPPDISQNIVDTRPCERIAGLPVPSTCTNDLVIEMAMLSAINLMEQMLIVVPTSGLVARVSPTPCQVNPHDTYKMFKHHKWFVGLFSTCSWIGYGPATTQAQNTLFSTWDLYCQHWSSMFRWDWPERMNLHLTLGYFVQLAGV